MAGRLLMVPLILLAVLVMRLRGVTLEEMEISDEY